ncbi:MAG TPA: hypothetical protein VEF34_18545 [Syntrophobacteraceae bacterium]|nr:hypothetical protein [Syntrophobacteraceae bacterium]
MEQGYGNAVAIIGGFDAMNQAGFMIKKGGDILKNGKLLLKAKESNQKME